MKKKKAKNNINASIIIITKDRLINLRECLYSIENQTVSFSQIIIVDGSLNYDTTEFILTYKLSCNIPIIYIHDTLVGYAYARNVGIQQNTCPWIAFTDDDCVLDKYWLEKMSQDLNKSNKHLAFIGLSKTFFPTNPFSLAVQFFEIKWKESSMKHKKIIDYEILDTKNIILHSSVFEDNKIVFSQESINGILLSTDDIDMGMQFYVCGYTAGYNSNAIVYHKDPSSLRTMIKKIVFDRISYFYYEEKWSSIRFVKHDNKLFKNSTDIYNILFKRYEVPLFLRFQVYLLIFIVNKIILFFDYKYSINEK